MLDNKTNKSQKYLNQEFIANLELSDLHCHLGFAADYKTLWEIAVRRGMNLGVKNFKEFQRALSVSDNLRPELRGDYLRLNIYDITESIQSDPEALKESVFSAISKGYRENNLTLLELRFNPILRSCNGKLCLDKLITAAIQGMELGMLAYPVKVGLIFSMDRRLTKAENELIVSKAIEYKNRGVVGIDMAGPYHINEQARSWKPENIKDLVELARASGLGITIHTGDTTDAKEVGEVVRILNPDRIGHGVYAAYDRELLEEIARRGIVLETCPEFYRYSFLSEHFGSLNLVKDFGGLANVYKLFKEIGVKFTINTDGPEMQNTSIRAIMLRLLNEQILSQEDILKTLETAREASFIRKNRA